MIVECCRHCVAPKRHRACWDHCPEYIEERAEYDKRKAAEDLRNAVKNGIYSQKSDSIIRAIRRHGSNRKKRAYGGKA